MKSFPFVVAVLGAGVLGLKAQSSPSPGNPSAPAANALESATPGMPSPSPTAPIEPPSLIPSNILPPPNALPPVPSSTDLELLNSFFKQTSLGKAADEYRLHLQMSALETRIRNDDDLHAANAASLRARTDLERRHLLKNYYQLYYRKLLALAETPDLKTYITAQEAAHELTLLQPRVRHQTDEAQATALAQGKAGISVAPAPTPAQAKASAALPR